MKLISFESPSQCIKRFRDQGVRVNLFRFFVTWGGKDGADTTRRVYMDQTIFFSR